MKSKYLDASTRHKLMEHVSALKALRSEISAHEEQLIRVAYKPRLTSLDMGKVYSALNCLAALSNEAEASHCRSLLRKLGLSVKIP